MQSPQGSYKLTVCLKDNQLTVFNPQNDDTLPLIPISENKFIDQLLGYKIEFKDNNKLIINDRMEFKLVQ